MSRTVNVEAVQLPYWSTRAIAWGFDVQDGYHVAFAMSKERAGRLLADLESEGQALVKVPGQDILFAKPSEVLR